MSIKYWYSQTNKRGFSLIELVVSLAIFGVMIVLMSSIVLSMARFSLENEYRSDILAQLDNVANTIKNDFRSAQKVDFCNNKIHRTNVITVEDSLGNKTSSISYEDLKLDTVSLPSGGTSKRLAWFKSDSGCGDTSTVTKPLTSTSAMDISNLAQSVMGDSKTSAKYNLIYIRLTVCDPVNPSRSFKVFDCTGSKNPFKYVFGISTKNANG